jgi:hypothetical protein
VMKRRSRRGHSWLLPTKGAGKWRREESVRQSLEESTRPPEKDGLSGKERVEAVAAALSVRPRGLR